MAAIEKVKVIVVGDSGVGKSSLARLICHNQPISNPSWTIGCSVDVKLHEYKEGTPHQKTYFVELWDIGGSSSHRNTRSVFYNPTHGIILVHDLTNRKSQQNLQKWLAEVINREGGSTKSRQSSFDDFDPEQFVGSTQIPILVIGTKLDLSEEVRTHSHRRSSTIAEECGADEVFLDCRQVRSLAAGTSSAVKLSRFFDKVIERRYYNRDGVSPYVERRQRQVPVKFFHKPRMLMFCPTCANLLAAEEGAQCMRFSCPTCPYVYNVSRRLSSRIYPKLKEVDDVLGGAAAWDNVDSTEERCPRCSHPRAYFMQIQTRSADEPMTTFYKCCNHQCGHRWRE